MPEHIDAAQTVSANGSEGAATASSAGGFDPAHADMPVICKDCDREFAVPYRHFQAGVVFHCPHCHGSFVPRLPMYLAVSAAFERFMEQRSEAEQSFARNGGEREAFEREQAAALEKFQNSLHELARAMRPAGKLVRRKGLAAMFT
jgi:hypothetical protein